MDIRKIINEAIDKELKAKQVADNELRRKHMFKAKRDIANYWKYLTEIYETLKSDRINTNFNVTSRYAQRNLSRLQNGKYSDLSISFHMNIRIVHQSDLIRLNRVIEYTNNTLKESGLKLYSETQPYFEDERGNIVCMIGFSGSIDHNRQDVKNLEDVLEKIAASVHCNFKNF